MQPALKLHPDSRCAAVRRIEVDCTSPRQGVLELRYAVLGKIEDLRLPAVIAPERADELWQHTCFEAFVWPSSGKAYYELNLAPSTRWAAYHFDDYRSGMRVADEIGAPMTEVLSSADRYELRSTIALPGARAWRVKPAAVIEESNGEKSYWAFSHPPGQADFHHASGYGYVVHFREQT